MLDLWEATALISSVELIVRPKDQGILGNSTATHHLSSSQVSLTMEGFLGEYNNAMDEYKNMGKVLRDLLSFAGELELSDVQIFQECFLAIGEFQEKIYRLQSDPRAYRL